jgi:ABC-type dipeptide/oligopeptide/nickel transport system permease subunit
MIGVVKPGLDSLLAGDWPLYLQVFWHLILPILILTTVTTIIIAKKCISEISRPSRVNSIISNSLRTAIFVSLFLGLYFLVDFTFALHGFGSTFITALKISDIYLLQGYMFVIIILFVISIFVSNLFFILKNFSGTKEKNFVMGDNQKVPNHDFKEGVLSIKEYFLERLKSPFSIVGVIIIVFLIFLALFPQIITPYTLSDITPPNFGGDQYAPPSPEHPLGTAYFGYDLLALVIWGIRDLLASGGWILLICLMGGVPFGVLATKFERSDKSIVLFVMNLFFIFPSLVIILFMLVITELDHSVQAFIIGISLIPVITLKIVNIHEKNGNILGELIPYIPLVLIIVNILYSSVSFIGLVEYKTPQLGFIIHNVQRGMNFPDRFLDRYFAAFWAGLGIFMLNVGLLLLHLGLDSKKLNHNISFLKKRSLNEKLFK